jgi:hypothetical protein
MPANAMLRKRGLINTERTRRALACLLVVLSLTQVLPRAAEGTGNDFLVTDENTAPTPSPQAIVITPTPLPALSPAPYDGYPALTADGFMPAADGATPEFVYADNAAGRWIYISGTLNIAIERLSALVNGKETWWYVSDIRCAGGTVFTTYSDNEDKPGSSRSRPEYIARKQQVVYAQNGDLFTWRVEENKYPGLIIRNGRIIKNKTYSKAVLAIPSLDELSLYPDGRMEVRAPGELSANGYLASGATDVLAFGPILVRDGKTDPRLIGHFTALEPRSAIGMIAQGHYIGVMVEGRNKRSAGATLLFVAERMLERGCVNAFNLDGGQTAAMVFMGDIVMDTGIYNGYTNTRKQPDIIGIGRSAKVREYVR